MSFKSVLATALTGIYSNILLDSRGYTDIQPLYPSAHNPLLTTGVSAGLDSYIFCLWSFVGAAIIYEIRLALIWRKTR